LDGAFAEYVIVPKPMVGKTFFHIPEGIGWEEAATIEPIAVACYAVTRTRIQPNETVVILGAGMIGQGIAQVCKTMGARTMVSEPSPMRRAVAKELGADIVLNPSETDPIEAVAIATSGDMAGVVFECSGSAVAFRQAAEIARPFGKIVQVGIFEEELALAPDLLSSMFAFKNLTLRGSGGQRWDMAVDLVRSGQVKTSSLITQRFPLERIKEGFETQLNADNSIKVVITP
jgi:threonine dehydrogenase-like Zn-dependent dehydrogenase